MVLGTGGQRGTTRGVADSVELYNPAAQQFTCIVGSLQRATLRRQPRPPVSASTLVPKSEPLPTSLRELEENIRRALLALTALIRKIGGTPLLWLWGPPPCRYLLELNCTFDVLAFELPEWPKVRSGEDYCNR